MVALDAHQLLFTWLGAEPGQYFQFCTVGTSERKALDEWLGEHQES